MEYYPDDVEVEKTCLIRRGQLMVSKQGGQVLCTKGLGSGVAVAVYDPSNSTVGLAHVYLPSSRGAKRPELNPGAFADTAMETLFAELKDAGSDIDSSRCIVSLIGGARSLGQAGAFAMGSDTLSAIRDQLKERGVVPMAEDVAGHSNRSVSIYCDTGDTCVTVNGKHYKLL